MHFNSHMLEAWPDADLRLLWRNNSNETADWPSKGSVTSPSIAAGSLRDERKGLKAGHGMYPIPASPAHCQASPPLHLSLQESNTSSFWNILYVYISAEKALPNLVSSSFHFTWLAHPGWEQFPNRAFCMGLIHSGFSWLSSQISVLKHGSHLACERMGPAAGIFVSLDPHLNLQRIVMPRVAPFSAPQLIEKELTEIMKKYFSITSKYAII